MADKLKRTQYWSWKDIDSMYSGLMDGLPKKFVDETKLIYFDTPWCSLTWRFSPRGPRTLSVVDRFDKREWTKDKILDVLAHSIGTAWAQYNYRDCPKDIKAARRFIKRNGERSIILKDWLLSGKKDRFVSCIKNDKRFKE